MLAPGDARLGFAQRREQTRFDLVDPRRNPVRFEDVRVKLPKPFGVSLPAFGSSQNHLRQPTSLAGPGKDAPVARLETSGAKGLVNAVRDENHLARLLVMEQPPVILVH